jgi:hypothetical protein
VLAASVAALLNVGLVSRLLQVTAEPAVAIRSALLLLWRLLH